jgi:hypothetical protein
VSLSVQGSIRGVRVVGLGYWYWEDEIVIPSDVIEVGEEFHACIGDTNKGIALACYKPEKQRPEKLTIDFNKFP